MTILEISLLLDNFKEIRHFLSNLETFIDSKAYGLARNELRNIDDHLTNLTEKLILDLINRNYEEIDGKN